MTSALRERRWRRSHTKLQNSVVGCRALGVRLKGCSRKENEKARERESVRILEGRATVQQDSSKGSFKNQSTLSTLRNCIDAP